MQAKEKVILPYSKRLTVPAIVLGAVSLSLVISAIAASIPLLWLVAAAFLLASVSFLIQSRRVLLDGKRICVKHFMGIIKEQSFEPSECGFFVASTTPLRKPTYIDKRVMHRKVTPEEKKYIYISEYVLSKQEQEGSQYIFGEPVLILEYSDALYASLSAAFEFNCEPFSDEEKKTVDK